MILTAFSSQCSAIFILLRPFTNGKSLSLSWRAWSSIYHETLFAVMEIVTSLGRNYSSECQIFFSYSLTCSLASFNLLLTDTSSKLLAHSHSQTHILVQAKEQRGVKLPFTPALPTDLLWTWSPPWRKLLLSGRSSLYYICNQLQTKCFPHPCPRCYCWHCLITGRQRTTRLPHEPK